LGIISRDKIKGAVILKMISCKKCGRIHALYHDCNQISIAHGVVFEDDRKCYDWNCSNSNASNIYKVEERILDSILDNPKENPLLIYE
jgi:hypothetical protein